MAAKIQDPRIPPADGVCHLFRLPGELRNRIYEYALTEANGLLYREDERGIGHLCLVDKPHGEHCLAASKNYKPSQHPRHLQQPGYPGNKQPYKERAHASAGEQSEDIKDNKLGTFDEANKLRFVNQQLFQETRGLGMHYNDISFEEHFSHDAYAMAQCENFLRSCSTEEKEHVRRLVISSSAYDMLRLLDGPAIIPTFCRMFPRANIHYHLAELSGAYDNFLYHALLVTRALQRRADFIKKSGWWQCKTRKGDHLSSIMG